MCGAGGCLHVKIVTLSVKIPLGISVAMATMLLVHVYPTGTDSSF